jgi:hypothetical protein
MRSTRTRRLVAATTTVLLFSALTACGGDGEPAAEGESTSSSPTAQASASEPAEESSGPAAGEEVDPQQLLEDMKAAVAEAESAHVALEVSSGGQTMTGEGDVSYAGDGTAMQMTMQAPQLGSGTLEMRLVDNVMYLAIPPMTPKGKFIKMDLDDPNSPFGDLGGALTGDPLRTFDAFDAGLESAEYVGQEEVDGETLDHYVLTVDAEKAAEAQNLQAQPGMPETITYDLWLDDQNLMRRVQFEQPQATLQMTVSDWGKPVTVEAPPSSAVMDMPSTPPTQS